MKVTAEYLKSLNACRGQVGLFQHLFPEGAEVTEATCIEAAVGGLGLPWLADVILHNHKRAFHTREVVAYTARGNARADLCQWVQQERIKYVIEPGSTKYHEFCDEFDVRREAIQLEYHKELGRAFYHAFVLEKL